MKTSLFPKLRCATAKLDMIALFDRVICMVFGLMLIFIPSASWWGWRACSSISATC